MTYTDQQLKQYRLRTCSGCIFASCGGNEANKCNVNTLTCGVDNVLVKTKSEDLNQTCPKNFFDYTTTVQSVFIAPRAHGGCTTCRR